jgi:hypothetical protein
MSKGRNILKSMLSYEWCEKKNTVFSCKYLIIYVLVSKEQMIVDY